MNNNKYCVLFNPLSAHGESIKEKLESVLRDSELRYLDIRAIDDYVSFLNGVSDEDVIICGGDGSINYFINHVSTDRINGNIYYYPCGSGNDFAHDIGGDGLICLTDYINDLPKVNVNGKSYLFLNGVGYGIDGYCCEIGDMLKNKKKKVNYAGIAIKGLLFHYKPTKATVVVDGVKYEYTKVWLAPTMKGRYYGGGMMISPDQSRNDPDKTLTVVVMHGSGKLKTLVVFPSIFKGEHTKHTEMFTIIKGRNISVEFDRETALQVDGETILNVKKYEVSI